MADAEYCVCCGEIIPEGRMVCPMCEKIDTEKGSCLLKSDLIEELEKCGNVITIEKMIRIVLEANKKYKRNEV